MADARRTRHHTHETNALSYGHLGTATYDEHSHGWTFLRRLQGESDANRDEQDELQHGLPCFQLVDERTLGCQAEMSNGSSPAGQRLTNGGGSQSTFLKNVADAAFALTEFPTSTSISEVQEDRTNEKVSLASALALGHARPPLESGPGNNDPTTLILAVAAESHRQTLHLLGFEACQVAVRNDAGLRDLCTLPSVTKQVVGHWSESADRILQVSSANQAKGTQFLVVKPSGTTILRPRSADPARDLLASESTVVSADILIDACPVVTIPTSRTGGSRHVHAAFNPRDENLVAIVDSSGRWSVWKLTGRKAGSTRILYEAHLQSSNNLINTGQESPFTPDTLHRDGWHQVCWFIGTPGRRERLLVCSRRTAAVFDQEGQSLGQIDMRLGPTSDRNMILDVKNSQRRGDHLFILTTSRLMIFSSTKGTWKERDPIEALELACSWNHFRDRADPRLRMSIVEFSTDSVVLVYSTSSQIAVTYRFGYESLNSKVISLQDPSTFELPRQLTKRIKDVCDIALCPVNFSVQNQPTNAVGYGLVKLIACTNNGELIEGIYKHGLSQFSDAQEPPKSLPVLALHRASASTQRSSKYVTTSDLDDFIVPDVTEAGLTIVPADTTQKVANDLSSVTIHSRSWRRLLDHPVIKDRKNEDVPFGICLQQAVELFEQMQGEVEANCVRLIADLVDRYQVLDVEDDSQHMESWHDMLLPRNDLATEFVAFPALPDKSQYHLISYYNDLVNTYVESLPDQLTDRHRVNRERLVRQVVGPAIFGTLMLKPRRPIEPVDTPQPRSASMAQAAGTCPSPALDSDDQEQSQSSALETSVSNGEPAVERLRQYTAFTRQVPPLLLDRNTSLSAVLDHLPVSIEEDPADYSYQQTNQRLKLVLEQVASESLDPKQRDKALKSAARLRRKLEKKLLMSQEVMLQRTLLPSIRTGTELSKLPEREVQSSQAAAPGLGHFSSQEPNTVPGLTMTQPERGAFGTREAAKKGKKRRAGF
ncbi:hypothetical protein PV04_06732 [Phialophora macrospora]|uniref:RNA polymerase I-specific transcription initiation factor RRN6-like protein n=1 Tax=Phialophora macrospora TaxID=1851006 RepID=A0A0D2DZF2_9EURO|nr:hypothetical protein PV04_06732 [Phialophora macrospora]